MSKQIKVLFGNPRALIFSNALGVTTREKIESKETINLVGEICYKIPMSVID